MAVLVSTPTSLDGRHRHYHPIVVGAGGAQQRLLRVNQFANSDAAALIGVVAGECHRRQSHFIETTVSPKSVSKTPT
jgi:hypothetical protein